MADDYYRYSEQSHTLFGENTKKSYRLGDKVRVQVVRVDMERRQIDLGLEDVLERCAEDERRAARRAATRGRRRSSARARRSSAARASRPHVRRRSSVPAARTGRQEARVRSQCSQDRA